MGWGRKLESGVLSSSARTLPTLTTPAFATEVTASMPRQSLSGTGAVSVCACVRKISTLQASCTETKGPLLPAVGTKALLLLLRPGVSCAPTLPCWARVSQQALGGVLDLA